MGVLRDMTIAFCRQVVNRLRRRRAPRHLPDPDDIFIAPLDPLETGHYARTAAQADALDLREEDE